MRALDHPEPGTAVRAAAILGRLRRVQGIEPLLRRYRSAADPYLRSAIVDAIGAIGGDEAREALREVAARDPSTRLRRAAARLLGRSGAAGPKAGG